VGGESDQRLHSLDRMGCTLSCFNGHGFGNPELHPPARKIDQQLESLAKFASEEFDTLSRCSSTISMTLLQGYIGSDLNHIPRGHIDSVLEHHNVGLSHNIQKWLFVSLFLDFNSSLPCIDGLDSVFTVNEILDFISSTSDDVLTGGQGARIVDYYHTSQCPPRSLGPLGFSSFLGDAARNSFADPDLVDRVYQDMSLPLSSYHICSSHNSYLLGNQWNSKSSGEAIKRCLLLGVRVVEFDCWENDAGDAIVNHGHTLCQHTTFKECVEAVRDYGHVVSSFPVIITLENHCSLEVQTKQAEILKSVLGEKLFVPNHLNVDYDLEFLQRGPDEWLSPRDLQNKVIVRDKPIRKMKKKDKAIVRRASNILDIQRSTDAKDDDEITAVVPSRRSSIIRTISRRFSASFSTRLNIEHLTNLDDLTKAFESKSAAKDLLVLLYIKNVKLKYHFSVTEDLVLEDSLSLTSSSIDEKKTRLLTNSTSRVKTVRKYTQRHMIRVYPANERIDSSNFNPMPAWKAGCQMVSLNYQTNCPYIWMSHGKFRDNGGSGYVLKPMKSAPPSKLSIKFISGHSLFENILERYKTKSIRIGDPFVEISMLSSQKRVVKRTRVVKKNCFNPVWNEDISFSVIHPEDALLQIIVKSGDKDAIIGQVCLPVRCIRSGYRVCPLLSSSCSTNLNSFLFCKITK